MRKNDNARFFATFVNGVRYGVLYKLLACTGGHWVDNSVGKLLEGVEAGRDGGGVWQDSKPSPGNSSPLGPDHASPVAWFPVCIALT